MLSGREGSRIGHGKKLNCNVVAAKASAVPISSSGVGVAFWVELSPVEMRGLGLCNPSSTINGCTQPLGRARQLSGRACPWQLGSECLSPEEESGQRTTASTASIQYVCCTLPFDTHNRQTHLISGFLPTQLS